MKTARFIPAARLELIAEIIYYDKARVGLGRQFAAVIEAATARALAFPRSGSPSRANTRRLIVNGFPFTIVYREEPSGIVIFAVAPQSKQPYYWLARAR